MSALLETLKALAGSKKVLSAVAGVLTLIGVRFLGLPEDQLGPLSLQITGIVATLLLGQGAADLGKVGKEKEAETMAATALAAFRVADAQEDDDSPDLGLPGF